ncbi:MAG: hypothetical protein EOO06_07570 [Chitinophagaceae bacterium]|nr:MAG: hypothetical protein EOO06_07570 [Chitinophagaceae bacterium]
MSYVFKLNPDPELLKRHGYEYLQILWFPSVWNAEIGKTIEEEFRWLLRTYKLERYYDTLLYICLVESNHAEVIIEHRISNFDVKKRMIELAKFIQLLNPKYDDTPKVLKLSLKGKTAIIKDNKTVKWISGLIETTIENVDINEVQDYVNFLFFRADENGGIDGSRKLNFANIDLIANTKVRKPDKRVKNDALARFLLRVLNYINEETTMKVQPGILYSKSELTFLFEVARIFDWLDYDITDTPHKYISSLLNNRTNRLV